MFYGTLRALRASTFRARRRLRPRGCGLRGEQSLGAQGRQGPPACGVGDVLLSGRTSQGRGHRTDWFTSASSGKRRKDARQPHGADEDAGVVRDGAKAAAWFRRQGLGLSEA